MTETIKIAEMEKNFDHYMDRCEAGETFIIEQEDGRLVAMVPEKDFSDLSMYTDHNDGC